eukprot:6488204-Amphidinium_carterae.1
MHLLRLIVKGRSDFANVKSTEDRTGCEYVQGMNFEGSLCGGGADWQLIALLPSGLPYPCTAPILCPKHPRLRDATRPKLLTALGELSFLSLLQLGKFDLSNFLPTWCHDAGSLCVCANPQTMT